MAAKKAVKKAVKTSGTGAQAKKGDPPSPVDATQTFFDTAAMADASATFPPGASEAELAELEASLGFALEPSLRRTLALANGCSVAGVFGEGLLPTSQILEQWKQFDDPRPLLPFSHDSGVLAYLVLEPGKHFGAVAEWDHDGDAWGEFDKPVAKSFDEFLLKQVKTLKAGLPKGLPIIPGLWKPGATIPTEVQGPLEAAVLKAAGKGDDISTFVKVLSRAPAAQAQLMERVLATHPATFLALEEHEELLASLVTSLDVDIVLEALAQRTEAPRTRFQGLLADFSLDLEAVMVGLLGRNAKKTLAAAATLPESVQAGLALISKRLALRSTPLPEALKDRVAWEGVPTAPYEAITFENGALEREKRPDTQSSYEFSLAVYFDSINDCCERVVRRFFEMPSDLQFTNWVIAPAARVCTPSEFAKVVARLTRWQGYFRGSDVYDGLRTLRFPKTTLPAAYLLEVASLLEDPAMRSELTWLAYRVAVDAGQALPSADASLRDPVLFYGTLPTFYQPVVQALGARAGTWASLPFGT